MSNRTKFLAKDSCFISSNSKIGKGCLIYPSVVIIDSIIGDNVTIQTGAIIKDSSKIGDNCIIGPSALVRSNSVIGKNTVIGPGSEIKNSIIGNNSLIAHKNFIGDAEVGDNVNFGFGSCIANYDFKKINKTYIGNNVKIGCNSTIISPIKIGDNSIIGACSKITRDIKENSFVKPKVKNRIKLYSKE